MTLDAQSLNLNARQILLKRLSTAQALAYTGPLGEVIIDTNLKLLRVQDGVTPGGFVMATSSNIAYLQSQINSILNNVDPAALDSLSEVVANVNALLANNIESQLVNSGFYANLGNTGNLTIDGSFLPKGHLVQDLGSPTQAWRNIYISSSTAYFGNAAVSVTSNGLTVSMAGNVLPVIANVRFPDGTTQRTAVDMAVLANIYTLLTPTVSANLNIIHNDISNATSHFGNIANAAVSTAQANLQAQIDYIKTNIDPAALDSLTEIIASFQNIDANIVSNIGTLGNVVGNLVATKDRLTSGNVQMLLTAGAQPSVQFPVGPAGQIIISEAEITALSGNLTLTSMGDAYILSNGDGAAPGAGKLWKFDRSGNLTLPFGTAIGSTANSAIIKPPTATSAQSLVLRPTAATWSITSSGNVVYGSSITISVNLLSYTYFGTVNYEITGPGITPQNLGRALTGNVVFAGVPNPDTQTVTWTIPANSNITEFTFTLTTVNGTRSTGPGETDPALYYNFEFNAMPTGSAITVTNNGVSNTEFSHIHLLAGDPASVDLYLGDDDQYVKIEKNAGNVVIGTNSNTKNWTFSTDGNLTLPNNTKIAPVAPTGYRQTFTQDVYGNTNTGAVSGLTVIDLGSNSQLLALLDPNSQFGNNQYNLYHPITITYSDLTTQTFTTARCTSLLGGFIQFGYNDSTAGHSFPITLQTSNYSSGGTLIDVNNNTWKFDQTGNLTLPQTNMMASPAPTSLPGITFSDGTFQTTAYTGAAAKVDITNTNGLTTTYYPTFVESRINGQYMRADVDLTYRTDDNLLRSGNIQVGRNIYGSHLGGISNAIQLRPNIDIDKRFLFTVDYAGGNYLRSTMEMPMAEVNRASTLGFPHNNGHVGYIYSQGSDANSTEFNNAFNIMSNGVDLKLSAFNSNDKYVWKFDVNGNLTLPDTGYIFVTTGIASTGASPAPSISGFGSATFNDSLIVDDLTMTTSNITVAANQTLNVNLSRTFPSPANTTIKFNLGGIETNQNLFSIDTAGGRFDLDGQAGFQRISFSESSAYIKFGTSTRDGTGSTNDIELFSYGQDNSAGNIYISAGSSPTNQRWQFSSFGKIRFPDATEQSTAWRGNIDTANGYINFTASPAPGTSGITFADATTQTTAYTATSEQKFDIKSTAFTAAPNTRYGVNTTSGAVIATLPASPGLGDAVFFADAGGAMSSNSLTIARNGNTIMGSAADIVVNTNGDSLGLFWNGTTWRLYE